MADIGDLTDISYATSPVSDGSVSNAAFWNTDILNDIKTQVNNANDVIADEIGTDTTASTIRYRITTNETSITTLEGYLNQSVKTTASPSFSSIILGGVPANANSAVTQNWVNAAIATYTDQDLRTTATPRWAGAYVDAVDESDTSSVAHLAYVIQVAAGSLGKASQAEVSAGTDNDKYVTPYAVATKLETSLKATATEVATATNDTKYVTPLAVAVKNDKHLISGTTLNGDQQDISLTTGAGNVYFEMKKVGGGDLTYTWNLVEYVLDCTTGSGAGGRAQVQLTEGTATTPVRNYIYAVISGSAAVLNASTTIPTGTFCWVAVVTLQSDTEVAADGALLLQRTTEPESHNGRGAVSYIKEKLRWIGAKYLSGIGQTLTVTVNGGSEDDVVLTTALGIVFQLHRQSLSSYDISSDGLWVGNASGSGTLTKYQKITDLNQCKEDSSGNAISDTERIVLTIWGSVNATDEQLGTEQTKLFVNLPRAFYSNNNRALNDRDNYAVTSVPDMFQTTAFLICKVVLKYETAASGTWTNLSGGTAVQDLRGLEPGFNLGGSAGSTIESFNDENFDIFDGTDSTKIVKFQCSGITTGTTRILTIPDSDGTILSTGEPLDGGNASGV